jgi:hypothetical protein
MRVASGIRDDSVVVKELGALSGVRYGERERRSGHQVATVIPQIVAWSTEYGPKWPEVCRPTLLMEDSHRVSGVTT